MEALTIATRGLFGRMLRIDEAGATRGKRHIAWSDVDHYRYEWHDWTRPGDLILVPVRGRVFRVEPIFDHWAIAIERLLDVLHPRSHPTRYVAPFTLTDDALGLGAERLDYRDIAQIELAPLGREVIAVVHARRREAWAEVALGDVANVWLWLELLVARGVAITSNLEQFLPRAQLAARLAEARSLPRAELVRDRRR